MTRRADIPEELGEVFSVQDATELGVPRSRLRAADLNAPFRGARARPADDAPREFFARRLVELQRRCAAFATVAPDEYAFSHVTAALLLGIAVPERLARDGSLHVAVRKGQPRRSGIVTHRVTSLPITLVAGVPVMSPTHVWLQLGGDMSVEDMVVAGDCLVRRKRPLATLEEVQRRVACSAGARGVGVARRALERVRAGTDSPQESRLRMALVTAGLPEPRIRFTVTHQGSWVGTPDLAYAAERIAIEYQGGGHRDEDVFEDDIARIERFREAGWTVIQVTKRQLADPRTVVARVRRALAAAGTRV